MNIKFIGGIKEISKAVFGKLGIVNTRSRRSIAHISLSGALQVIKILSAFLLVRVLIGVLGVEQYGVWATLSSMIGWFSIFDMGLENGLRNEIARKIALGEEKGIGPLIGTAYYLMLFVSACILILGLIISAHLDYADLLQTDHVSTDELRSIVSVLLLIFCIRLTFKIVAGVVFALQKSGLNKIQDTVTVVLFLSLTFILQAKLHGSIFSVALLNGLSVTLIWICFSILIYKSFPFVRPHFGKLVLYEMKPVIKLGMFFFLTQLASMIIFSTDQFIMINVFGPVMAAKYAVTVRIFQIPQMIFGIINAVLWTAFTDAYFRGDKDWIKRTLQILIYVWAGTAIMMLILFLFFPQILGIISPEEFAVPTLMIITVCTTKWLLILNSIYMQFINGVGLVKKLLGYTLFCAVVNIPFSYFLADTTLGPSGIILSTFILQIPYFFWLPNLTYRTIGKIKPS